MRRRIILFRALNTGGVRAASPELKAMAVGLGLGNPKTLLASGNLIVDSDREPAELEAAIEAETETRFGRGIETLVRTPDQWTALIAANPFPTEAQTDPSRLLAMVMKTPIRLEGVETLRELAVGDERVQEAGGVLWFWHPDGVGRSKISEKAQPRLIGTGTARNWNTVLKIDNLLGAPE